MLLQTLLAVVVTADFSKEIGKVRPELHSSGFGPQICSCPKENVDDIRAMGFKASRTHDWALINPAERVCDYYHVFPLKGADATKAENYVFGPTDYLLKRTREEVGNEVFFRLGTSIEHSGDKVHFNSAIPEDFEKVAETFAGTVRHYNRGWANGYEWGVRYWEIWNEPDGRNNMWCLPEGDGSWGDPDLSEKDAKRRDLFCRFYVTCLKRLKAEFGDSIKVGGPALCSMVDDYFRALLGACKAAGVAPDFISWHGYRYDPMTYIRDAERARAICDEFGFGKCELILDEWHFFGEYEWSELRSADPATLCRVWSGPGSHNGIDSSCFNLAALSRFQTSVLDQAFYYGCNPKGSWGYMDEFRRKYKVFYGLKMFGDFVKQFSTLYASQGTDAVTVLPAKSADGTFYGALVTDYRSGEKEIDLEVKGLPTDISRVVAWTHDATRDCQRIFVRLTDGHVRLVKPDASSAAFLLHFR